VFHLLKGPERDDYVLYASHSLWPSEKHFADWTRSEAFRKAHESAGANKPLYFGHPEFEGFTVLPLQSGPTLQAVRIDYRGWCVPPLAPGHRGPPWRGDSRRGWMR
jgi:hypothetical protein